MIYRGPNTAHGRGTASTVPAWVSDDNLLNFNEGVATTGWSISSGSGSITQASSSVRLTSTSAAVISDLSIVGPTASTDYLFMVNASAKYTAGQYSTIRLLSGATTMLDISLGYDHVGATATVGTISALSSGVSQAIATGLNYETTPQSIIVHVDRNYSCVNLFIKEAGGKWNFAGSFTYAAGFASIDSAKLITSAHNGQWAEYDWLGFAKPNIISIGDSICAGHNFFDPAPGNYAGVDSYANSWQKHATVYTTLRNNLILNKGIGSETSTQIQARMASYVTAHGPRLVYLHASTNDQVQSVSAATRSAQIQAGVDAINAISAKCILLNAMYGTSGNAINPAHRDYMDSWWTTDRLSLTGVEQFINIMTPMDSGSNYMNATLTESDGIHPKAAGYEAIGAKVITG